VKRSPGECTVVRWFSIIWPSGSWRGLAACWGSRGADFVLLHCERGIPEGELGASSTRDDFSWRNGVRGGILGDGTCTNCGDYMMAGIKPASHPFHEVMHA
jgi:hypothetical protein